MTYLLLVGLLVFSPSPIVASASVSGTHSVVDWLGAPDPVSRSVVEFCLNIALFVPMSLLGSWLKPRWTLLRWTSIGLLASTGIELVQLGLLPPRSATPSDIVANTVGALTGALLAMAVRLLARRRP